MKSWDSKFVEKLLAAPNYRTFLRAFFERTEEVLAPKPLSFQEFALRAGFSSKAFLNDVIAGRKRLTPTSIDKTATGLGLNGQWQEYFRYLVAIEEPDFQSKKQNAEYFRHRQLKLKAKLGTRQVGRMEGHPEIVKVFLDRDFPEIYASLGEIGVGETLQTIAQRANLSDEKAAKALQRMMGTGMVKKEGDRYVPVMEALEAEGLRSTQVFKEDFFRSLDKARSRFPVQANSDASLFMTQTVSISLAELPRLKKRLAETLEAFAQEAEAAKGDAVGEFCLSFTHNRG